MHQQIRTQPTQSPPDLQAFLTVLEEAGINIEAAGGSDIEQGGEFAFAVAHGVEADACGPSSMPGTARGSSTSAIAP